MMRFINTRSARHSRGTVTLLAAGVAAVLGLGAVQPVQAASHREAPITALDHKADITDFFAFVSYDNSSKVTLILNVDPLLEPSNGPNYFPFDPEILYQIKIDNDHDAVEDIGFEFRFKTEIRAPGVFTGFVGALDGINAPANAPAPGMPGAPVVPPAITALDGPGSEGLSLRQSYTVSMVHYNHRGRVTSRTELNNGMNLYAVPSNVGPRTMPDYESLVMQGTYPLGNGISVFAGTVDDPFWIDLGAAFDSLNFRNDAGNGIPGVLTEQEDADDTTNTAVDAVSGFNVNALAVEVPIDMLTAGDPVIGTWGTTSRPLVKVFSILPGRPAQTSNKTVQIQRMANPLFNELLIGTGDKDKWSMSAPKDDAQFAALALDPLLARVLNAIYEAQFGPNVLPVPDAPRLDLLPLVLYPEQINPDGTPVAGAPVADLLRLDTSVTPSANPSRLGVIGGDPAGFPNGRRTFDDVTDIAARVVVGVLTGDPQFTGFPHNAIGDGVNANDVPYRTVFPFLGLAHSGRDRRHVDPGETPATGL